MSGGVFAPVLEVIRRALNGPAHPPPDITVHCDHAAIAIHRDGSMIVNKTIPIFPDEARHLVSLYRVFTEDAETDEET